MASYFNCPSCGKNERFRRISAFNGKPLLAAFFICNAPIVSALFLSGDKQVVCLDCGHQFAQPPLSNSAVEKLAAWIGFIFITAGLALLMFVSNPELIKPPDILGANTLAYIIRENPKAFASVIIIASGITFISCLVAAFVGNHTCRKEVASKFDIDPPSST